MKSRCLIWSRSVSSGPPAFPQMPLYIYGWQQFVDYKWSANTAPDPCRRLLMMSRYIRREHFTARFLCVTFVSPRWILVIVVSMMSHNGKLAFHLHHSEDRKYLKFPRTPVGRRVSAH
ncbi:unnamed protein product [Somion occarium]|uniref:Uncharacterized protein n=1 Tax=Somion occarium TaxID=3059160 RepID=A0ABP1DH13_9APHY